jgi:hypothetical protein
MAKRLKEWSSQHRSWILVAGVLLAVAVLAAAVVAGIVWWKGRTDLEDATSPVLVDTTGTDEVVTEV